MSTVALAPLDEAITLAELTRDPYPIYRRLRRQAPVLRVKSVGRTFLTKWADTKAVKDNVALFSSNDPNTPMKRAFLAHTLMRKDHDEHRAERMAMIPALMPKTIENVWAPLYAKLAEEYLDRLPRGEVVDLFPTLAGPLAARILAHAMGVPDASDADMQRWSQNLIDGAGNFGWTPGPFEATDRANAEMDRCIHTNAERVKTDPDSSALSFMINAKDPIPESQMISNVKIAIGGGINEPRDALLTILYGLLTNPDQLEVVKAQAKSASGVRQWTAPLRRRAPVAADRGRHSLADAIRAVPEHEAAGSLGGALARIRFPRAAEFAGFTAVRCATGLPPLTRLNSRSRRVTRGRTAPSRLPAASSSRRCDAEMRRSSSSAPAPACSAGSTCRRAPRRSVLAALSNVRPRCRCRWRASDRRR